VRLVTGVELFGRHEHGAGLGPFRRSDDTHVVSRRSINRPARAKPTRNLRWSIEVDPSWERTTSSMATASQLVIVVLGAMGAGRGVDGVDADHRLGHPTLAPPVGHDRSNLLFGDPRAWRRLGMFDEAVSTNMSPLPINRSAPGWSKMTRLSASEETENAIRLGTFALMTPVMTSTEGRCVASTRWMPTARAIWAMRTTESSTSRAATIIRSFELVDDDEDEREAFDRAHGLVELFDVVVVGRLGVERAPPPA